VRLIYLLNQRLPTEKAYGIQVVNMCRAFAAQGSDVELVIPLRDARLGHDVRGYYKLQDSFSVTRLKTPDFYFPAILDRITFFLKQWISAWMLVRYAVKSKPDLIYARDESVAWLASFFGVRTIFEAHTFSRHRSMTYRRLRNTKVPIVTISASLKHEFEKIGFRPELIHIAPDGVNLEDFDIPLTREDARKNLDLPMQDNIVMYAGHLFAWKGAHILAQAARRLPDTLFMFIGGMPADLQHFRNRFRDQKNIRVIGQRPHSEIPQYLKAADVLVLPNTSRDAISRSYTSPLKLFEYMASRRPIVASDLPSIREVLNENNAILAAPDDPRQLALGIEKAFHSEELRTKIVEQAFSDVQRYSWRNRAASILSFNGRR